MTGEFFSCSESSKMIDGVKNALRSVTLFQAIFFVFLNYFLIMDILMIIRVEMYPFVGRNCAEYSPFCYVTPKGLLMDHVDLYIFSPFISIVDNVFNISSISFVTPNLVTFTHVCIALVAGRLVASHLLADRRLSAFLFEMRTLLDGLDGHIARARNNKHGEFSDVGTAGYYIDGVCDALGTVFFLVGLFIYMKNHSRRDYTLLPTDGSETGNGCCLSNKSNIQKSVILVCQLLTSSFGWNRNIAAYQSIVSETNPFSVNIVRSFRFQLTALLWRIVNPHAIMHALLLCIAIDRLHDFFKFIQTYGFIILLIVIGWSELELFQISLTVNSSLFYNNTITVN